MFVGSFPLRLDEKGRVALPVRFRDQVSAGMVITKGQERCLYGLTLERVAEVQRARAAAVASDTAKARALSRLGFGSMAELEPDRAGRITIPASLREYAGLDRDVVVVGVDTRFEIWDSAAWDAYVAEQEAEYAAMESEGMPTLS
ncbi:division/cell wall cluster transcriptional repressor MraZ [Modestobacter sp. I12A-02628]|uniref:Transcriptional regulator MraZ n=1 Tax=Goekera deserti TaxID=2497753 RepID=A0A7K3WBQ5_9ACTN|nr:division/cell wall cluster transcriptional repressor MraZ [Goekera deserti]MPQ97715.1 division/cell wall cluster transcriptional repressor MraZ [Goekera deserti]NDI47618.1 division/cell wall cluster transcriptional repressor MraZ [Goekera deserti]NDI47681.1 division/cell wall cluster transcriptional repressor MraZ [Goekera deserti]NEL53429.1 division/cell wall cluster transcriptional repressor MraZ [Goekera deserti]